MDDRGPNLWWGGITALLAFAWVWYGLATTYGVWAALFGWLPAAIIAAVVGLIFAFFWPAILGLFVIGFGVVWWTGLR